MGLIKFYFNVMYREKKGTDNPINAYNWKMKALLCPQIVYLNKIP